MIRLNDYKNNKMIVAEFPLIIEIMKNYFDSLKPYRKYKSVHSSLTVMAQELNKMKIDLKNAREGTNE